ncbi:MAG: hypothetical protein WAQ28_04570 [Bacteroidia bacterium]|jgi:hypothetical protein
MVRFVKLFSTLILFVLCVSVKAQTAQNQSVSKKYVRMDIGHGALHCPFLSPKLEAKLREVKDVDNFFIDKRTSYITFELPANTAMTVESLKAIGTEVGYPPADVMVSMDNKPIKTTN